ncbi:MAG: DsbA family oxidoreductase [Isosphaeraceae bacterium]|nr:DsbA family oxidoreductase [Isosphaeraceae bacterium]
MLLPIAVYFDYVCPYCFLAERPLAEATAGRPVRVEWRPFELRPYPTPTLRPEDDYLQTTWTRSVYPMARALGVEIRLPPISPQPYSHLAFEGFQYAREHGQADTYNHRVFTAFFQEGQDIGRIDVLTRLAGEVGLDAADFRRSLEERRYREAHQAALRHAYEEAGITVVPTFLIGDQVLRGLPDAGALARLIDEELARMAV